MRNTEHTRENKGTAQHFTSSLKHLT
ncbi:hypothetical protein Tsp_11232, partial [Trichinella spiralis]